MEDSLTLILSWKIDLVNIICDEIIPVLLNGRKIGDCIVECTKENILGHFSLNKEINNDQYVLYTVPLNSTDYFISGIVIVDDPGIKMAKTVGDMRMI